MIIRRADIEVERSQGFNPHSKIFFGPPLGLCIESVAEYFVVYTTCLPTVFMDSFNTHSINGLSILKVWQVDKDPNIYSKIYYASYKLEFENSDKLKDIATSILQKSQWLQTFEKKGTCITKDIRPLILSIDSKDNTINCVLNCGNLSLRASQLCQAIQTEYGISASNTLKYKQFDKDKNDIDDCISLISVGK